MTIADYVQIAIACIMAITLIIICWQSIMQNRLFRVQMMQARLAMSEAAFAPISDTYVNDFEAYPEERMDKRVYETRYRFNKKAVRRYLKLERIYRYLAFVFVMRRLKLGDPFGRGVSIWAEELCRDDIFVDVHTYQKAYYPELARFIDGIIQKNKLETT